MDKKICFIGILAFIIMVTLCRAEVFAENAAYDYVGNTCVDSGKCADISWTLDKNGTLTVSGNGNMTFSDSFGNRIIPWENYSESITDVIIETGITSVDSLSGCINLKSLTIPPTVKSVSLSNETLSSIYISDTAAWCEIKFDGYPLSLGADLYINGIAATEITVPKSVSYISDGAFNGYSKLKSLYIESENLKIENYAFEGCTGLTEVYGLENVTETGSSIFSGCTQLKKVSLPKNAAKIPFAMFRNCTSLENVDIPERVTEISANAFKGCTGLKNVVIPDNITGIGDNAFENCVGIKTLTLGKGVKKLGKYSFYNCTGLETLNWNARNISDSDYARTSFENIGKNTGGTAVVFGDTAEKVPAYAFSDGSSFGQSVDKFKIKSITVGENVDGVGDYAFINIGTLEKVNWNAKSAYAGSYIFNVAGALSTGIEFVFGNTVEHIPSKILYGFENSTAPKVTSVVIGTNVKSVGDYAFNRMRYLKTVYWNAREANVGKAIFAYDRIYNNYTLIFGADVEKIPIGVFESAPMCNVVIECNISNIGADTFKNAKIWNMTIPKSVLKIEEGAFKCNELRSVHYCGTAAEWGTIEKCEDNVSLDTAELNFIDDREICFFSGEKVLKKYRTAQNAARITFEIPRRTGHEFMGWSSSPQSSEILYMPGDTIPAGESDVYLYAVWEKAAYTTTIKEKENGRDVFVVTPNGVPLGSAVIFVCFKNGVVTDVQKEYNNGEILKFYTDGNYTDVRVMTLNESENLIPVTEVEKLSYNETN